MNLYEQTLQVPTVKIIDSVADNPTVTIAIPTYRRADRLERALESALSQTDYEDFEVIVVDNDPERGCATEKFMSGYADIPRLAYYKNTRNVGMAGNWNKLFQLAKGRYVVMLHDDDYLFPDYLHSMFVTHGDILSSADVVFPTYCRDRWHRDNFNDRRFVFRVSLNDLLYSNIIGPPVGMVVSKEVLLGCGGFTEDLRWSIDYDFYINAVSRGYRIVKIGDKPTAFYNCEDNTSMRPEVLVFYSTEVACMVDAKYSRVFNPLLCYVKQQARRAKIVQDIVSDSAEFGLSDNPYIVETLKEKASEVTQSSKFWLRIHNFFDAFVMKALRRRRIKYI